MQRRRWWALWLVIAMALAPVGQAAADPALPPPGAVMQVWLAARLGPAAEWAALPDVEPAALPPATEAALAAWLRRVLPGAPALVRDALPGHLARRALRDADLLPASTFWAAVLADDHTLAAYGRQGLGHFALDPAPAPETVPPAAWLARGRLYWYTLEVARRQAGAPDLWHGLAEAAAAAAGATPPDPAHTPPGSAAGAGLAVSLAAPVPGFYETHAAPGWLGLPPEWPPMAALLADPDGDGLATGLEYELGTNPQVADAPPPDQPPPPPPGPAPGPPPPAPPEPPPAAPPPEGESAGPDGRIRLVVDGREVALAPPLRRAGDRVMVPMRALFSALGAQVEWDAATQPVVATLGPRRAELTIGRRLAEVSVEGLGTRRLRLPATPMAIDGATYIPLRFAGEALGATVHWDPATQTVFLTSPTAASLAAAGLPAGQPRSPRHMAYLTFDDGPDPQLTARVLDILWEYSAPATFFVVGRNVEAHPGTIARIHREGHLLGTHSWDHDYENVYRSPADFADSLLRTASAITRITGQQVELARAPGGRSNQGIRNRSDAYQPEVYWTAAHQAGFILFDWNVSGGDSLMPRLRPDQILENVKWTTGRAGDGPLILLFHDNATHENTVAALPAVLDWLIEQGYDFALLSREVKVARY